MTLTKTGRTLLIATAACAIAGPLAAQQRQPTPEQRIERLERQVRQVQRRVFPQGQPADTAGLIDDPAVTQSSQAVLLNRLDAVERQLAEIVRSSEENGNRVATMEAELARLRADQDRRLRALESSAASEPSAPAEQPETASAVPPAPKPKVETKKPAPIEAPAGEPVAEAAAADPAEAAYDAGYQLWRAGKFDQAYTALNKMAKDYPNHRRTSWGYNLAGRSLLDKGEYRRAAEVLLANYRRDPRGERAQDSVFYLGQALTKLGQPGQACKAYEELVTVYGDSVRPQLAALLPAARAEARCS